MTHSYLIFPKENYSTRAELETWLLSICYRVVSLLHHCTQDAYAMGRAHRVEE